MTTTRLALVTGASRGIGAAIAAALAADGCTVLSPGRSDLDLLDRASVDAWLTAHQHLPFEVLVNNAGINEIATIDQLSDDGWDRMLATNLEAPFRLARGLLPGMWQRRSGRVVNLASIWAQVGREGRGGYAAAKAGLVGLTRVMALESAPHGVLVNAVLPGFVGTELTHRNNPPEVLATITARIPLGRLADPAEIATAIAWLCSPANTYLTGQAITIDGGYTIP